MDADFFEPVAVVCGRPTASTRTWTPQEFLSPIMISPGSKSHHAPAALSPDFEDHRHCYTLWAAAIARWRMASSTLRETSADRPPRCDVFVAGMGPDVDRFNDWHGRRVMDYVGRVEPATTSITVLSGLVMEDLDEDRGGVGWWTDQIGWKRSALLGEYLLASCAGIATALFEASLAEEQFRQLTYADNSWIRGQWTQVDKSGSYGGDHIAAIVRGPREDRRSRLIDMNRTQTLGSLATGLDRVAAVVAVVAGMKTDILRIDWSTLMNLGRKIQTKDPVRLASPFIPPDMPGRQAQTDLLNLALAWPDHGPADWLPWLMKSRNTAVHRAVRQGWRIMLGTRRQRDGFTEPFWRQPEWSDTEAMLQTDGRSRGLDPLLLPQLPEDVLDGLLDSTIKFIKVLSDAASDLWLRRRQDPALIVQHGGMWPKLESAAPLHFPGYGPPAQTFVRRIHVAPDMARRLKAAKLMEADLPLWQE